MKTAITTISLFLNASIGGAVDLGEVILRKLDQTVIPIIDFEDTSVEEALDYLRVRAIELDESIPPEEGGVSIVVRRPMAKDGTGKQFNPHGNVRIRRIENFKARDITLSKALIEIGTRTKTDIYVTTIGVVVCPQGENPFPNPKSQNGKVLKQLTPSQKAIEK